MNAKPAVNTTISFTYQIYSQATDLCHYAPTKELFELKHKRKNNWQKKKEVPSKHKSFSIKLHYLLFSGQHDLKYLNTRKLLGPFILALVKSLQAYLFSCQDAVLSDRVLPGNKLDWHHIQHFPVFPQLSYLLMNYPFSSVSLYRRVKGMSPILQPLESAKSQVVSSVGESSLLLAFQIVLLNLLPSRVSHCFLVVVAVYLTKACLSYPEKNGRMDLFYWKASPSVQPSKGGSCSRTSEKMQHVIICCSFCLGIMEIPFPSHLTVTGAKLVLREPMTQP